MPGASVPSDQLILTRLRRPDHDLLVTLAGYDQEAFGKTGLRTYDLAVMAEAGAVYLAHIGDDIVGGCQLLRVLDEPGYFYMVGFYVRAAWEGRSMGGKILGAVTDLCKGLGAEGLMLTVAPDNVKALRLYRSAGFVDEAYVPGFYGEGEDRYIMRLRFAE
jgi:ribosomal-protein-alanine N-acetyltransferase